MVRNGRALVEFERGLIAGEPPDYVHNYKIVNWLYREAVTLKAFPPVNPLEGIETDIRVARIINSV